MSDTTTTPVEQSTLDARQQELDAAARAREGAEAALAKMQAVRAGWSRHHDATLPLLKSVEDRMRKAAEAGDYLAL